MQTLAPSGVTVLGIVGLVTVTLTMLSGCSTSVQTEKPIPSVTASVSEAPVNGVDIFTVKSLEIPSSSSPEQVAIAFSDRLTRYFMASSNPLSYKELLAYEGGTSSQFAKEHASKDSSVFNDAMFVEDFRSVPGLVKYANTFQILNESTTTDYSITAGTNPLDLEKYQISSITKPGSVKTISQDANSLTLQFNTSVRTNADKNRIGSLYDKGALEIDGTEYKTTATFVIVDNEYKISLLDIETLAK